ncbi:hypothetical protein [Legionella lansingensis]|nr:hypothetical protein [Legionella lansingensis]
MTVNNNLSMIKDLLKLTWNEGNKFYSKYIPGFFVPYRDTKDTAITLSAPICAPLLLGVLSALAALIVALAITICLLAYIVAGSAALFGKDKFARESLDIADVAGVAVGVSVVLTPSFVLATLLSLPASLINIFTRAGATFCGESGAIVADKSRETTLVP